MTIVYVNADGSLAGMFPKPNPFHNIPPGGRMLPVVDPVFDPDLQYLVSNEPVPSDATEVTFRVVDKDPATVAAVLTKRMTAAIQKHLDTRAQERNYDGIMSAASYATSVHPKFGPEGVAYRDWRDACWDYGYQVLADVQAGLRQIPTAETLIAELPSLTLPS